MKNQMDSQNKFFASFKKNILILFSKIKSGIKLRYKYLIKNYYFRKIINQLVFLYKIVKPKYLIVYRIIKRYLNPVYLYFKAHTKVFAVTIIFLVLLILFFANNKNTYIAYLFYPDKFDSYLKYERREIIKDFKKVDRVRNSIDELLLGPISPELDNIFPKESKLLSVIMENDELLLNFNKNLIMDIDWDEEKGNSKYRLLLSSIVNTICFQFKDIKRVRFFFNGQEYRYIGDAGPVDKGMLPDWSILKR